jgi:isoaspartyl peptidase/L-asparaginase-like protein (Ntn-hydrolase superfamily)
VQLSETPAYNAGVVVFPGKDGYVRLQIVTLDADGEAESVLQAIKLPPHIARSVAQKLTMSSWKIGDNADIPD